MTGLQLKNARKQKRWTQALAARHLRLTQGYLSLLEKGEASSDRRFNRGGRSRF